MNRDKNMGAKLTFFAVLAIAGFIGLRYEASIYYWPYLDMPISQVPLKAFTFLFTILLIQLNMRYFTFR